MTFSVSITTNAKRDISEAIAYYKGARSQLAADFLAMVYDAIKLIQENPARRAIVFRQVRRMTLHRFPYVISYTFDNREIVVIAVSHGGRHARHWKQRFD